MPNTEQLTTSIEQPTEDTLAQQEQQEQQFLPGELVAVDATNYRVEIDPEDPQREQKENCIKGLAAKVAQRDITSRRLEVRDAWKARYFGRGNQHLLPGPKGTWITPSQVMTGGQSYDDKSTETNIYLGFQDILTAALTASLPSVRQEPEDPTNGADISAAENSNKAQQLIERNNDMLVVLADQARFLYTDGRCCMYVRHILDGQRFGYSNPGLTNEQEEISYLPETGGEGPAAQDMQQDPANAPGTQGQPRGSEVFHAYGVLETKVAIQARNIHQTPYLQFSEEQDISKPKTLYPDKADEIKAGVSATSESEYERLARTSIMMGMRPSSTTSDSQSYNATIQRTWMRPEFFTEESDDVMRTWLYQEFPKGLMCVIIGQALCEQRNESMDDHWSLAHARSGDGMHRPALGSPVIPIQEKLNDVVELVHESFMHLIPRIWLDPSIDRNALNDSQRRPGQYLPAPKPPAGKGIADAFFVEPQIQIAEGINNYMQWLFGEGPQFLSGGSPALFGGDTKGNDTLGGITIQRDQALGRIGLTWRNIRSAYAMSIKQAIMAAAEYREEMITGSVPGQGQQMQKLSIDPNDLKGNIRCYPDQDDNFPESWVAKRAIWNNIIQMSEKNPVLGKILATSRNMMLAKDKAGLPEIVIPGADSATKQIGEIMILLQSGPEPNPKYQEAVQALQAQAAAATAQGIQIPPQMAQQAQQSLPPQVVSTVPIGKLDRHADEMNEIESWANSPEGIRTNAKNPDGFENVMTHYDEHAAALKAMQGPPPEAKGPSESINFKDLPIDGQVQLAAKGGITLNAANMQAEEQQDKVAEAAKAAKPPLIQ
jgi:hypothetical protein